ncbi:unnamed protein product [Taenia asiatica]|uniref:Amiloride-sensitive sodium channel n=1 Tax=Taenia asiatica TaxID=60517 RepID=A0A0R3VTE2_TAEAS|nr:unnamed protein product [Taenia asiatica]
MVRRKSQVKSTSPGNEQGEGWLAKTKANCIFFLESTSIRGCSRIVRSENRIIRYMWATYLCFTTLFLHISIMKLVFEYMEYAVNIQTYNNMDAPMAFPTVTFCNHQPFSARAYQLWRNESVISPTRFNQLLRHRAANLLAQSVEIPKNDNESVRLLDRELLLESLRQAIVYDTLPLYYQSLPWPTHLELGHSPKDLIALCLLRYSSKWAVTGPGCEDSALRVRRQSNPKFFNCFSVEIVKEFSQHIRELGLVLWLGPDENHGKEDRQAFLFDLFEQAYGLRVSIHEPGQMANLDRHSFQVAPGRMNELTFQTVQSVHNNRPTKPCFTEPKETFTDLEENFYYEFELCLKSHLQQQIIDKCGYRSMNLMDKEVVDRREKCAESIVNNAAVYRKVLEDHGICLRRCVSTEYESKVSVTVWRPTGLFDAVVNGMEAKLIEHFLKTSDLDEAKIFDERYTYLEENLVLTVNALFSRIGGLCSLYIGLTLAVFMEIVEFIYLSWIKRKGDHDSTTEISNKENDASAQNSIEENHMGEIEPDENPNNQKSTEMTDTLTVV